MEKFIVHGPCRLEGEVTISGAKNAAVAILPATLLVKGKCHLENVPNISDIRAYCKILESLGSKIEYIFLSFAVASFPSLLMSLL